MTYFSASELRLQAAGVTTSAAASELSRLSKSASGGYDTFLSHSFRDATLILGLKRLLESAGLHVYVDWIDDPLLDRDDVSPKTAARLRDRMKLCKSLVYATSQSATMSRWMPWELGFFDGTHGPERVAICPIQTGAGNYAGEEYLGLYKTLESVREGTVMRPYVVRPGRREAQRLTSFAAGSGAYSRLV